MRNLTDDTPRFGRPAWHPGGSTSAASPFRPAACDDAHLVTGVAPYTARTGHDTTRAADPARQAPFAAGCAALVAALASPSVTAVEEPGCRASRHDGACEVREDSACVVAETRVEKIAMTAPESLVADGTAFRVACTLPAKYSPMTAPKPLDPTVPVRGIPARLVACWRDSGRSTESSHRDHQRLLREQIRQRGLVTQGDPILAPCDPPLTRWLLRRHEVRIRVARGASR